jgi:hypothetical protein
MTIIGSGMVHLLQSTKNPNPLAFPFSILLGESTRTMQIGYMHAHRILKKVVEQRGCNEFLRTKDFHTGVTKDYRDIRKGIEKVIKTEV